MNQLNKLFNKLKSSGSPKKLEAVNKIADRILRSQDSEIDKLINPIVAVNSSIPDTDELSEKKIVIIFENYNQSECELARLDETSAKALTHKLQHLTSIKVKELPSSGLIRDDISDDGDYHNLYKNLEPDITLKEIKFAGDSRFFGFFKGEYFSLITIWVNHANTD